MTTKQIYETIVSLTAEIKQTGVGEKIFHAAKKKFRSGAKIRKVCTSFQKEYSDLYQKMQKFAYEYGKVVARFEEKENYNDIEIFGPENPFNINATSYFVLVFITKINDTYMFSGKCYKESAKDYLEALKQESGSFHLSHFLEIAELNQEEIEYLREHGFKYANTYELLADVFKGRLIMYS